MELITFVSFEGKTQEVNILYTHDALPASTNSFEQSSSGSIDKQNLWWKIKLESKRSKSASQSTIFIK